MDVLRMDGITKRFGPLYANRDVSFDLRKGEIHALLGENGAGKTTLMKILYGMYSPDSGSITLRGQKVRISSPKEALRLGIGMVHQHFMLVSPFTVAENVALGLRGRPLIGIARVAREISALSEKYGLRVDPRARIQDVSVGEQERVEIIKALYRGADILILDEPTAVLTPKETEDLFSVLRSLKADGHSIIIITHKLEEIMAVTDRVTVLRSGQKVATVNTDDVTRTELARMMVGREVFLDIEPPPARLGAPVLQLHEVSYVKGGVTRLDQVAFDVRAGEIVGIAGVDGNGQRELAEVITGLARATSGKITIEGEDVSRLSVAQINARGVAHIPEDRLKSGLLGEFSLAENLILQEPHAYCRRGLFRKQQIRERALQAMKEFDIRSSGPEKQVKLLSGGNQQKVILARELGRNPKLLLAVQPTRGLDVGATEYVRKRIAAEKTRGTAVLLISTELDEVLSLSDRVCVIYEGKIMGTLERSQANRHHVGLLMAGSRASGGDQSA